MKRALVIGLGVSGEAAAELLRRKGYEVVGIDDRFPSEVTGAFDEVVVSPGIPKSHPLYCDGAIGEVELALRYLKGPAVGITGTNGKTTVTLMVAHVLNACGVAAKACGNVGTPLSAVVETPGVAVIELSSYQLETMSQPVLDAGVLLNIGQDHLDRYASMEEYAAAKLRLHRCVKGPFWVPQELKQYSSFIYDRPVETILRAGYKGIDSLNAHAAFALCCQFGVEADAFVEALATFEKPPHRMERIGKIGDVLFVNDSKATNPDAVVAAVKQLEGPIWLIAGGQDKGVSFAPWKEAFKGRVARILLIGEGSVGIREAIGGSVPTEECETLERAMERCRGMNKGTALLSPGCASFDQFANYQARGEAFRALVGRL